MCVHPTSVKCVRYIIVRGYRVRQTICRVCQTRGQRERRAVQRAFRMLARMPVP